MWKIEQVRGRVLAQFHQGTCVKCKVSILFKKCCLSFLFHVLVSLRTTSDDPRSQREVFNATNVRIEEEGIHAPRERLDPPVHVLKFGCGGEFTAMFFLDVLEMCAVFDFSVVNPCHTDGNLD